MSGCSLTAECLAYTLCRRGRWVILETDDLECWPSHLKH